MRARTCRADAALAFDKGPYLQKWRGQPKRARLALKNWTLLATGPYDEQEFVEISYPELVIGVV